MDLDPVNMGSGASVNIRELSSHQLADLVASLGGAYESYREAIISNDFTGDILSDVQSEDELKVLLESIGITNAVHEKNLYKKLTALNVFNIRPASPVSPLDRKNQTSAPIVDDSKLPELRIDILNNLTVAPKYLLEDLFKIQGIDLDGTDVDSGARKIVLAVRERVSKKRYRGMMYDCFISYRVSADADVAEKLYLYLKTEGLNPFWDKRCLVDGENWKDGFLRGLRTSCCFLSLLSTNALERARNRLGDHSDDNYLIEIENALNVRRMSENPLYIVPVLIGQYVHAEGIGRVLKKFSDFDTSVYAGNVKTQPWQVAHHAAQIIKTRADEYENSGSKDYNDAKYHGQMSGGNREGYGRFDFFTGMVVYALGKNNVTDTKYMVIVDTAGNTFEGEFSNVVWGDSGDFTMYFTRGVKTLKEGFSLEGEWRDGKYQLEPDFLIPRIKKDEDDAVSGAFRIAASGINPKTVFDTLLSIPMCTDLDPDDVEWGFDRILRRLLGARKGNGFDAVLITAPEDVDLTDRLERYLVKNGCKIQFQRSFVSEEPGHWSGDFLSALQSASHIVVLISNKGTEVYENLRGSLDKNAYLMQLEAMLRVSRLTNAGDDRICPVNVMEYREWSGVGRVSLKFRRTDGSGFRTSTAQSPTDLARLLAEESAAKANQAPGSKSFNDGSTYTGDKKNDNAHGWGVMRNVKPWAVDGFVKFPGGCVYEGEQRDGWPHGYGKLTYRNGDVFYGEFERGRKVRHGVKVFVNDGVKLEGVWVADVFQKEPDSTLVRL